MYGTAPAPELFEDDLAGECPYPGLSSFGPDQAKWFFGRARVIAELRTRLDQVGGEGSGPVVVIGASGAGKSSLVRCGLINAVTTNGYGEAGSRDWPHRVLTPTRAPIRAIAGELATLLDTEPDVLIRSWSEEPTGAATALRAALGARRVLLVVDQFEELFTADVDVDERDRFVELLDSLCRGPDAPAMVVIGLRADCYGHCLAYPRLSAALRDNTVQLGPMTWEELRQVVAGPAADVGLTVRPELLQALLADMGEGAMPGEDASGRLPLLAHALRATWLKRHGRTLTLAGYQDTGGIPGAIRTTAERTFRRLSEPAQFAARLVFLRLVRIGPDTEDTRRHVPHDELVRDLPGPDAVTEVVDAYTAQRLLTRERDGVVITHEALLRAWDSLSAWIDADRAGHVLRQELDARAGAWAVGTQGLLDDITLRRAETWARQHPDDVTTPVTSLMTASRRSMARRRRTRRTIGAVIVALALVASATAVYANNQRGAALAQNTTAVARLVANESTGLLDSEPGLAKQLALVSYGLDHDSGQGALFSALSAPGVFDSQEAVVDIAETRNAATLALSTGTAVALWSTEGHAEGRIGGLSSVGAVTFAPDGRTLAAAMGGSGHGSVRLWSIADPSAPRQLGEVSVGTASAESLAISSTGTVLAVGTTAGRIRLWDITDPHAPRPLPSLLGHPGGVDSLAFAPAAPVLASSGADHQVRLWSVTAPIASTPLAVVDGYHNDGSSDSTTYSTVFHRIAFSPNGEILATPGNDTANALQFWDVRHPRVPRRLAGRAAGLTGDDSSSVQNNCQQSVRSISFSPSGGYVATVCPQFVTLWQAPNIADTVDVIAVDDFRGVDEFSNGPAIFAPRNHDVLHATRDGVQDWNVTDAYQPGAAATLDPLPSGLDVTMAFSQGPRRLFAVVGSGSGELWDLDSFRKITALPGGDLGAASVTFSPNGHILADSENTHNDTRLTLRLRDTTRRSAPVLSTLDSEIEDGVHGLSYGPDGQVLAVADNNDDPAFTRPPSVKLFDVTKPRTPRLITTLPADAYSVLFSPDGRLLTANTADTLLSWDVSDPRHPVRLPTRRLGRGSTVSTSAFSSNGQLLAVGDSTGTVRLWRMADDRPVGDPSEFRSLGYGGDNLAFDPDGRTLALNTAGNLQTSTAHVELWDVSDPAIPVLGAQFGFSDRLGIGPITFSPNGRALATGIDQKVDIWAADAADNVTTICASPGDVITPRQWSRYVPDEPYEPPCGR